MRSPSSLPGRAGRSFQLCAAVAIAVTVAVGCGQQSGTPTAAVPTATAPPVPANPQNPPGYAAAPYTAPVQPAGQPVPPAPVYQNYPAGQQAAPATVQQQQPVGLPQQAPVAMAPPVRAVNTALHGELSGIEPIRERPSGSGGGAVLGGVLGAVVGNQFGHGTGRAALTGLGAVGGAVAGNNVERNMKERVVGYRLSVRLDNGQIRSFEETRLDGLRIGDRVRIEGRHVRRG
jgi:outer membrane lipoprotein SlyB